VYMSIDTDTSTTWTYMKKVSDAQMDMYMQICTCTRPLQKVGSGLFPVCGLAAGTAGAWKGPARLGATICTHLGGGQERTHQVRHCSPEKEGSRHSTATGRQQDAFHTLWR